MQFFSGLILACENLGAANSDTGRKAIRGLKDPQKFHYQISSLSETEQIRRASSSSRKKMREVKCIIILSVVAAQCVFTGTYLVIIISAVFCFTRSFFVFVVRKQRPDLRSKVFVFVGLRFRNTRRAA